MLCPSLDGHFLDNTLPVLLLVITTPNNPIFISQASFPYTAITSPFNGKYKSLVLKETVLLCRRGSSTIKFIIKQVNNQIFTHEEIIMLKFEALKRVSIEAGNLQISPLYYIKFHSSH